MIIIKYEIKNYKNLYIKLDEHGKAVTCSEAEKGLFEYSKAKNIVDSLPKNLKKSKFEVEAVPEIPQKKKVIEENNNKKETYTPSENITRWIDKFGACGDILNEAKEREKQLLKKLNNTDNELVDILHIIELEKPKDLYGGWLIYKRIKLNRKMRRELKDELLIVENVINEIDPTCLQRDRIRKAIKGLFERKYTFKIVEEDSTDVM